MMVDLNRRQFLHLHYLPFEVLTMIAQNIRRGDDSNYDSLIAFASAHSTLQQFGECELYYHLRLHDCNTLEQLLQSLKIERLRKYAWNTKVITLGTDFECSFDYKDLVRLARKCTNVAKFMMVNVRRRGGREEGPGVDLFGVGESILLHRLNISADAEWS
jgi:hypothetical protein